MLLGELILGQKNFFLQSINGLNKANIHFSGPITPFPESVMALMPVDSHPLHLLHEIGRAHV